MTMFREGWRTRNGAGLSIAVGLLLFYVFLYFGGGTYLGVRIPDAFEPLARALGLRSKWYLYGALYSVAMIAGAVRYLGDHGNSAYNRFRIATNVAVQIVLAFGLPFAMSVFGAKDFYFSYFWPLKIEYLYPQTFEQRPVYLAVYSTIAASIGVPLMAVLFGKRWYCSWVCGCGGLANTFGDPWRHLTSKSTRAWRFEQVSVHAVLVLALATTALVGLDFLLGDRSASLHAIASPVKSAYGFVVGALLAGIVGVGFYPLMGPRVWCRNFCPMAALLGLAQKLGRFRIAVKPDMCISCGNCSTYCEMGIDVRAYAQANQSFVRAACVGCGMCAHVCPRGVLKLESTWTSTADERGRRLRVVG